MSGLVTTLRTRDTRVKGWCPGVLRPMRGGDGLLVRLKISGGIVDLRLAARIAEWSRRWGNGQLDLSSRGNLQLRGLAAENLEVLRDALAEWDLLDPSAAGEAVRNVVSSPLAGLDPGAVLDVRPIARALEQRLARDAALHGLPGKFGFVIDDGGRLGLDDVAADVRFRAYRGPDGPEFAIRLAGASGDAPGRCRPDALVDVAVALGQAFLDRRRGRDTTIRRMADLVRADGAETIACTANLRRFVSVDGILPGHGAVAGPREMPPVLGGLDPAMTTSVSFLGVGLPFGRVSAEDFARLASAASEAGASELRLTPWRAILVPVASAHAARTLAASLSGTDFILDPDDPRRRVAACPGAPSCPSATTPVRDHATTLAASLPGLSGSGIVLHVSGCDKGCAHPREAAVTLVARDGHYDLVRDGIASSVPAARDLALDQVIAALTLGGTA